MASTDPLNRLNIALEDRYRIDGEIGEGGMATVYLAEIETTANLQHTDVLGSTSPRTGSTKG